ncbi:hypothetical protein EW026_g3533 [Hermanssonia centrifuga]|uniref:Cytidyltransferase-like domain-containing protein n=1 Tax=Hermanssonia centrifuga TaxID=98765 RepID=A0A4S4KJU9_9APHY|nr:hypothetical protein EW026_g3533 [Hermanssonia centrifuga]
MPIGYETAADTVEPVDKSVLIAKLDTIDTAPQFLSEPISAAATKTLSQLRIILISSLFNSDSDEQHSALGTSRWDDVQRTLTYVYVQATKVAQEMDRILMDVDVLLKGENEALPESLYMHAQSVFLVSTAEGERFDVPSIPTSKAIWLARSQIHSPEVPPLRLPSDSFIPRLFPVVALGGTFDHLHAGHKILLSMAAWITQEKLIIGMTDDSLLQKKANKDVIQPLPERISCTHKFLELFKPSLAYDLVPLTEVAGPTGWDPNIQALVVSKETISGAEASASLQLTVFFAFLA